MVEWMNEWMWAVKLQIEEVKVKVSLSMFRKNPEIVALNLKLTTTLLVCYAFWVNDCVMIRRSNRGTHCVQSSPSSSSYCCSEVTLRGCIKSSEVSKNHLLCRSEGKWRLSTQSLTVLSIYNHHMSWLLLESICLSLSASSSPHTRCFVALSVLVLYFTPVCLHSLERLHIYWLLPSLSPT